MKTYQEFVAEFDEDDLIREFLEGGFFSLFDVTHLHWQEYNYAEQRSMVEDRQEPENDISHLVSGDY